MKHKSKKTNYGKNLKLIIAETLLSSIGAGFSVSIMNIFWNSIGMNQTDIGFTQMIFTIVIIFFDIPMGYLADRYSRKWLNVAGDIGVAIAFLIYAFSQNMFMAITSECLLGLFMAMTNGVDQSFIKYNCDQIDNTGELFKKINSRIYVYKYSLMLLIMSIGGFIAKYSLRLSIGISFIPYLIAGILAANIKDFDIKKEAKHKNPIKDLIITVKEIISTPNMKTKLLAYMLGREITHAQIWVYTPLMIMVGIPIEIVSAGWIIDQIMRIIGARIGVRRAKKKTSTNFLIAISLVVVWISVILIKLNIYTVWIFALNGITVGLVSGTLQTSLQESAKSEIQTSVMSVASTGARLLYIPVVYIVNYLGNIKLQYSLIGVLIIFVPISIIVYYKLRKLEKI